MSDTPPNPKIIPESWVSGSAAFAASEELGVTAREWFRDRVALDRLLHGRISPPASGAAGTDSDGHGEADLRGITKDQ